MISSIKNYEENEQREKNISDAYESLVKDFNEEAKRQKSKFKLKEDSSGCLLLRLSLNLFNNLGNCKINYNEFKENFSFEDGIDEDIFKEVESILKEIKQNCEIEVIKND